MLAEPLAPTDARTMIQAILARGTVVFSSHAQEEMTADGIDRATVLFVLRGGVVEPAELERGSWRYRVRAARVFVVVAFRSKAKLVVVTAWRVK